MEIVFRYKLVEDAYLPTTHLPFSLHTKFHGLSKDVIVSYFNLASDQLVSVLSWVNQCWKLSKKMIGYL